MPRLAAAPRAAWRREIARVLISERRLARRVRELAAEIERDHRQRPPILVPLLSGTLIFAADLVRQLDLPLRLDFMGLSSYRDATRPAELVLTKDLRLDIHGQDVLVVEDILDSGRTLQLALNRLRALQPRRLRVCVLLDKAVPRTVDIRPDYTGFRIPDVFVVGYGLDYAERFRNLPYLGVLRAPP